MRVTEDTIKWSIANLNQMRYVVILLHIWSGSSSIIPFYFAFLGFNFSKWAAKNKGFHCSKSHFSSVQVLTVLYHLFIAQRHLFNWGTHYFKMVKRSHVVWPGGSCGLAGRGSRAGKSIYSDLFLAARKRRMLNQTKPTNILKYSLLGS